MKFYEKKRDNGFGDENSLLVSEIIGRQASPVSTRFKSFLSIDRYVPNYEFWDKLRRGKAEGYEFAGLFCRPITEVVASFVLGHSMQARLQANPELPQRKQEHTDALLARFCSRSMGLFWNILVDLFALGDQFVIVNADGSLSVPSPDTVEARYDLFDYRKLQSVTVTSRFETAEIEDTYTDSERILRIKYLVSANGKRAGQVEERRFPNLIGRIPVIHFANDRSSNETHGRPIYEALIHLLSRYNDLIEKGLDGAELMGNPIPVLSGLDDLDKVQQENQSLETSVFESGDDGYVRDLFNFDTRAGLLLRGNAKFDFVAPSSKFTDDIRSMLELLFLLQLDHTRLPEALWGGAIASSKASAETQMPPFFQYIEGKRLALEGEGADTVLGTQSRGGFLALFDIWLAYRKLTDPDILTESVEIVWSDLSEIPPEVRFQWTSWLRQMKLLSSRKVLELSGLVEDVETELQAIQQEVEESADQEEAKFRDQLMRALQANQ